MSRKGLRLTTRGGNASFVRRGQQGARPLTIRRRRGHEANRRETATASHRRCLGDPGVDADRRADAGVSLALESHLAGDGGTTDLGSCHWHGLVALRSSPGAYEVDRRVRSGRHRLGGIGDHRDQGSGRRHDLAADSRCWSRVLSPSAGASAGCIAVRELMFRACCGSEDARTSLRSPAMPAAGGLRRHAERIALTGS